MPFKATMADGKIIYFESEINQPSQCNTPGIAYHKSQCSKERKFMKKENNITRVQTLDLISW